MIGRLPWATLVLTGVASALYFHPELAPSLSLTSAAVSKLELWRLISGHFVHFERAHAFGDIAGFVAWAAVLELCDRRLLLRVVSGSSLCVSLLVLVLKPQLEQYRGLSAIDCALASSLVMMGLVSGVFGRTRGVRFGLMVSGLLLLTKTGYELSAGHALLAPDLGSGIRLLPESHVLGIISGAAISWLSTRRRREITRERASDRVHAGLTSARELTFHEQCHRPHEPCRTCATQRTHQAVGSAAPS